MSLAAPPRPNPSPAPVVRVSGARVSERAMSAAREAVAVTRLESLNQPSAPTEVDCTERAKPSRAGGRLWPALKKRYEPGRGANPAPTSATQPGSRLPMPPVVVPGGGEIG